MKKTNSYYHYDRQNLKINEYVLGLDEVGRGCWAGNLIVCGVLVNGNYFNEKIKDSKLLSFCEREEIVNDINKNKITYFIKSLNPNEVDKYGPKLGSQILMTEIINEYGHLASKILIDYENLPNSKYKYQALIKGDCTSYAIAMASILAKQYRDKEMIILDKKYPNYGFKNHKGYGTKQHTNALKKYGPIMNVHRFSYKPIKLIKLFEE
ncbi:ribonuclease HII [Mycoplasmoides alvi]|uniref:ribonuclease HII n=1 Tax=Mycoplasmoides alvi TaxID=78580 RepID=UPI00051BD2DD|nr:ribonuclease HII [Mycoplasmoides alvi]